MGSGRTARSTSQSWSFRTITDVTSSTSSTCARGWSLGERPQDAGEEVGDDRGGAGHRDAAGLGVAVDARLDLVDEPEDLLGDRPESPAGVGQDHPPRQPLEQGGAQLGLQLDDLLR